MRCYASDIENLGCFGALQLSFCINSHPSRLASSLFFFCYIPSLSCSMSLFSFLPSDPFFGFQESTSEIEQFFTFTPLPVCLNLLNIPYIFALKCIVYGPILYSPVSACLYLRLRQIIIHTQRDQLVFSIYIEIKYVISVLRIRTFSVPLLHIKCEDCSRFFSQVKHKNVPSFLSEYCFL